jgi:hypothetical protein
MTTLKRVAECDWVVEVIKEDVKLKNDAVRQARGVGLEDGHRQLEHLGHEHQGHDRGPQRRLQEAASW